nr:unnamed protein product [Callosobruchus analis]
MQVILLRLLPSQLVLGGVTGSRRHHRDRSTAEEQSSKLPFVKGRRSIRSSPKPVSGASSHQSRAPYSVPSHSQTQQPRKSKNVKTVSGSSPNHDN